MIAVSVRQPMASLLASGWARCLEVPWTTPHRGPILIHASRSISTPELALAGQPAVRAALKALGHETPWTLPRGKLVAMASLSQVVSVADWLDGKALCVRPNDAEVCQLLRGNFLLRLRQPSEIKSKSLALFCPGAPGLFKPSERTLNALREMNLLPEPSARA